MKPPATVWVGVYPDGTKYLFHGGKSEARLNGWFRKEAAGGAFCYRLDTPKPRKTKKRGAVAEPTEAECLAADKLVAKWGGPPSVYGNILAQALAAARSAGVDELEKRCDLAALVVREVCNDRRGLHWDFDEGIQAELLEHLSSLFEHVFGGTDSVAPGDALLLKFARSKLK